MSPRRLTKREKRQLRQEETNRSGLHLNIQKYNPITKALEDAYQSWKEGYHLALLGSAGTGKTRFALQMALIDLIVNENIDSIYTIRSAVATREIGHLPGTPKEKMSAFERPYIPLVNEICNRGDAYGILTHKGQIKFESTSFLRGLNLSNCYIIIDECQSMSFMELDTIITRAEGDNVRIILCGDTKQDDLTNERKKEKSGLIEFISIIEEMPSFEIIDFTIDDVVRSGIVKEYLIAKDKMGL